MCSQSPSKSFGLAWRLLSFLLFAGTATAQNLDDMKPGVVRITAQVEGKSSVGTGFVVHITGDTAFIVTAARVIEGDSRPQVVFLTEPGKSREARVVGLEGGNAKGLAALAVEGPLPQGLLALSLDFSAQVGKQETVSLIGFPRLTGMLWAVTQGSLSGQKGRALTFTAPADEGNSGGPLIRDGKVIGVITEVSGQAGYAAPSVAARFVLEGWGIILDGSRRSLPQGKPGEVQNKSAELLRTARLQNEGKDFKGAWRLTQQALEVDPTPETFRLQNQVAMAWLRNLVVRSDQGETFTAVADEVLRALYRGAISDDPALAADSFAHIGWANFLKRREPMPWLEVEGNYRKAVELDPQNAYAQAMWGHWILWEDTHNLVEARQHFSVALKGGRDRDFVRHLQLAALQNAKTGDCAVEIIRVLDEIRRNGEPLERAQRSDLESSVYFALRREVLDRLPSVLASSEHLATYQWLVQDLGKPHLRYEFWVARLTEATGDSDKALALYRSVRSQSQLQGFTMGRELEESIKRCEATVGKPR